MRPARFIRELMATMGCLLALAVVAEAQPPRAPLPLEPEGDRGEAVFPALEGWYRNADGSYTILLGYFNRNAGPVDIPVGPDNQIQPGGPDLGQPSHFHSRPQLGGVRGHGASGLRGSEAHLDARRQQPAVRGVVLVEPALLCGSVPESCERQRAADAQGDGQWGRAAGPASGYCDDPRRNGRGTTGPDGVGPRQAARGATARRGAIAAASGASARH